MDSYLFNFILVGSDLNVGTNSIISKVINNNNSNNDCKTITINNKYNVKQLLSDSKSYDSVSPDYGRVQAFFIVFDLTNSQSFSNIDKIIKELKVASWGDSLFIIVGNKSDVKDQRQVTLEQAKEYSKTIGSQYFEISAKDNTGINDIESMFYYATLTNLIKKNEETGIKSIKDLQCFQNNAIALKYLIVGDKSTGKSTLHNSIKDNSNSIINDAPGYINSFIMDIENKKVAINTIEFNGGGVKSIPTNIDSILMVVDITNKSSMEYLEQFYQDYLKDQNKKVLLIGNKCDVDQDKREVSSEEAKSFANEKLNCNYIEASFIKDFDSAAITQLLSDFTKDIIKIIQVNRQITSIKKKKSQQKKDCIIC